VRIRCAAWHRLRAAHRYSRPMSRPVRFKGKVHKPTKFGEGMQPGTVDWEMNQRRHRAEERQAEREWAKREPEPLREPRLLDSLFAWIGRLLNR
jgi:hypothetical protein